MFLIVCNTDRTAAQNSCMSKLQLSLDKRSQCHTSTQVLMVDYCNQGKDDYSDMIVH